METKRTRDLGIEEKKNKPMVVIENYHVEIDREEENSIPMFHPEILSSGVHPFSNLGVFT